MRLVERLDGQMAVAVECDSCRWTGQDDNVADGLVEEGLLPCPVCGSGTVRYTFVPGDKCGNCGELAFHLSVTDSHGCYCNRACLLQAEWARALDGAYG